MRSRLANGTRLNIAAYAQVLALSIVQFVQLIDGDVIALALLHSGVSQKAERSHNHGDCNAKAHEFAVLWGHFANLKVIRPGNAGQAVSQARATFRNTMKIPRLREQRCDTRHNVQAAHVNATCPHS